jgi:hypothetical protein
MRFLSFRKSAISYAQSFYTLLVLPHSANWFSCCPSVYPCQILCIRCLAIRAAVLCLSCRGVFVPMTLDQVMWSMCVCVCMMICSEVFVNEGGMIEWTANSKFSCPVGSYFRDVSGGSYGDGAFAILQVLKTRLDFTCEACPSVSFALSGAESNGAPLASTSAALQRAHCQDCPFGGSCAAFKVVALPGYWGIQVNSTFVFTKCPSGYCCDDDAVACDSVSTCAGGRIGRLCGGCPDGFTNVIGSVECRANADCDEMVWLWCTVIVVVFAVAVFMLRNSNILCPRTARPSGKVKLLSYFFQVRPYRGSVVVAVGIVLFDLLVQEYCPRLGLTAVVIAVLVHVMYCTSMCARAFWFFAQMAPMVDIAVDTAGGPSKFKRVMDSIVAPLQFQLAADQAQRGACLLPDLTVRSKLVFGYITPLLIAAAMIVIICVGAALLRISTVAALYQRLALRIARHDASPSGAGAVWLAMYRRVCMICPCWARLLKRDRWRLALMNVRAINAFSPSKLPLSHPVTPGKSAVYAFSSPKVFPIVEQELEDIEDAQDGIWPEAASASVSVMASKHASHTDDSSVLRRRGHDVAAVSSSRMLEATALSHASINIDDAVPVYAVDDPDAPMPVLPFHQRLKGAALNWFLFTYSSILTATLNLLLCVSVAGYDGTYLFSDATVACDAGGWQAPLYIAVVLIVGFAAALPFFSRYIHKTHYKLGMHAILCSIYKDAYPWWESVLLAQRLLLSFFRVFLVRYPVLRLQLAGWVCLASLLLHLGAKPMVFRDAQHMQTLLQICLIVLVVSNAAQVSGGVVAFWHL